MSEDEETLIADALICNTDGSMEAAPKFTVMLKSLQALVGGYIEVVPIDNYNLGVLSRKYDLDLSRAVLVVNEEGRMHNLDWNRGASVVAGRKILGRAILVEVF